MPDIKESQPLVSIVIVNWNGLEDTKECLEHTQKQTYPYIEIIVVDNGSTDGSVDYLRKQKNIKLVENPKNLGFTGGHIAGYQASAGDYILLLNNDAAMDSSYVSQAVLDMTQDEKIGAVGGRAYLWDEDNRLFDRTDKFYSYQNVNPITAEGIFAQHDFGVKQSVNVVSGSCVMVRKKTVEEIGYLHDPFFAYYEESDLFARMKRAGYKIIYDPALAIWHANAKTSAKKAPTFSLYMMMRNRFRFAVRNFDGWSLCRFLKFYLKMGIASIVKSVLPLKQRPMHRAYAKAFFYNLAFGCKPFIERRKLKKALGRSDYNRMIVREQSGISIITACETKSSLESLIELSISLEPIDEILAVTDNESLNKHLQSLKHRPSNFRLCADRGYFRTHSQNLGSVCAKNEWLLLSEHGDHKDLAEEFKDFSEHLYDVRRSAKKLAVLTDNRNTNPDFDDVLKERFSRQILVERDLFIDEFGLDKSLSAQDAKRQLVAYSCLCKACFSVNISQLKTVLGPYAGKQDSDELRKKLVGRLRQAASDRKTPTALDKITATHYRLAQLRNLSAWFFYPKIPLRLKVARTRNLVFAALTLNRASAAVELKHMRNEVMIYKNSLNVVALKQEEQDRLQHLLENPSETPVFIILRDRFESLKQLLKWLEAQNLKKIIFIDNDSKLPPLVDFLDNTKYQVLELARNMKQTAPWSAGIIKVLVQDDFYVVTDPDVIPARDDKDVLTYLYKTSREYPHHLKVGLGLKIDDLPDYYPLKEQVVQWESQFWKDELEPGIYEAGVDTTFALYKPRTYRYILHPSIRTGEPYTARHLPWYTDMKKPSDEDVFYGLRADHEVSSWHKEHLPERYKKEIAKM